MTLTIRSWLYIGVVAGVAMLLAAGAAGMALHACNVILVIGMVVLRKGRSFWTSWKETYAFEAVQEGGLLTLGLVAALMAAQAWWGLVVLLVPFVLAYYGFERIVKDAGEKARLAEQLARNLKELKELQAHLVQSAKLASVGTLAAGVAHEINNPIFAIGGRAELLLNGAARHLASEKAVSYVTTIQEMATRITEIVRQLLDYSRPSEEPEEVRLDEAMDGALSLLRGKLESKRLQVDRDYHQVPPVMGVENQLQQLFVNVLGNAIDATPEWGQLTVGCGLEEDPSRVTVYVRDTGVGIAEDVQDRLFEPFFTTKDPGKGTGLGLFICHTIASSHGGRIGVESERGKGTMVWLELPVDGAKSQGQTEDQSAFASEN